MLVARPVKKWARLCSLGHAGQLVPWAALFQRRCLKWILAGCKPAPRLTQLGAEQEWDEALFPGRVPASRSPVGKRETESKHVLRNGLSAKRSLGGAIRSTPAPATGAIRTT
jgi:hypothetical protein